MRLGALGRATCWSARACGSGEGLVFTGHRREIGTVESDRARRDAGARLRVGAALAARARARATRCPSRASASRRRRACRRRFEADVMNQTLVADHPRRARAGRAGQPRARAARRRAARRAPRPGPRRRHRRRCARVERGRVLAPRRGSASRRARALPRRARLGRRRRRQPHGRGLARGLVRGRADPGDARADDARRARPRAAA